MADDDLILIPARMAATRLPGKPLADIAGLPMIVSLLLGPLLGLAGAAVFGFFAVQLSGVYFAMLTLAFSQIVWSIAFQWVAVTGGDNGILGVWPVKWAAGPARGKPAPWVRFMRSAP